MRARGSRRPAAAQAFAVGAALFVVHLVDHVAAGERLGSLLAPGAFGLFCVAVAIFFDEIPLRLRVGVTALCAAVLGYGALAHHVLPIATRGVAATDTTGAAALAAAVLMAAVSIVEASRVPNHLDSTVAGGV